MIVSYLLGDNMDIIKPRLDLDELERKNAVRHRYCIHCGHAISRNSELNCCINCQETLLFQEVRDYIRENNVNEFQVAEHFGLPLSIVKRWMKERRIEYVKPTIIPK